MADDIDRANDIAQHAVDIGIAKASMLCELPPIGVCHNCGAVVLDDMKFCDADCRDDWQFRLDRHAR